MNDTVKKSSFSHGDIVRVKWFMFKNKNMLGTFVCNEESSKSDFGLGQERCRILLEDNSIDWFYADCIELACKK